VQWKTKLPETMSTSPPPMSVTRMPSSTDATIDSGSSVPGAMSVFRMRGIGRWRYDWRRPFPVERWPSLCAVSRECM